MSEEITNAGDIPDAGCYVVMRDRFMSGWGRADGRIAEYIAPCRDYSEAEIVRDNAQDRGGQSHIRIVCNRPRLKSDRLQMLMSREDSARWYRKYGFAPGCDD